MGLFPRFVRTQRPATYRGQRPKSKRLTLETLETRALVTADLLTGVPLAMYSSSDGSSDSAYVSNDYVSSDGAAAAATPQAGSGSSNFLVSYTIQITQPNGTPITGPILVGQTFDVDIYVEDLRNVSYAGVASGALDLAYDPSIVTPTGTITPGSNYPLPSGATHGSTGGAAGTVTNVQGSQNLSTNSTSGLFFNPVGNGPVLLDRVQMTATGAGMSSFQISFSAGEPTLLASGTGAQDISDSVNVQTNQIQTSSASVTVNPTVTVQPGSVTENTSTATNMQFHVTLSVASSQDVTLNYQAVSQTGDTAVGGTDLTQPNVDYYAADSTTSDPKAPPVVIAAGNTTATINIPIAAEPIGSDFTRTFHLNVTATNATPTSQSVTGTINVSAAASLSFTTQPSDTQQAGVQFETKVSVLNSIGGVDTGYNGNVTIALANNPTSATLGGTLTAAAVNGVADFNGLHIEKAGSGYSLQATVGALPAATSSTFDVLHGTGFQLVPTIQPPTTVSANGPFEVKVAAEDFFGNVDTSYNANVTIALQNPNGATLGGTLSVAAVNGVADFTNLTVNQLGTGYTLQFASGSLLGNPTNSFDVTAVPATQLIVSTQPPANVTAGSSFDLKVTAEDANGHVDTTFNGPVTIALTANPGNDTLGGTLTANAVNGVADFSTLMLTKAATGYAVTASSGTLATATSNTFNVAAATATHLAVTTQPPASVAPASGFTVQLAAEDSFGNVDTSYATSVSIALANNPSSGTLSGQLTVTPVNGVATFSGLSVDKAGTGYTLQASSGSLPVVTTTAMDVDANAATQLVVTVQPPSTVVAGNGFDVKVAAKDAQGNVVTSFNGIVTLAIANNPSSGTLAGNFSVTAVNGVADFSAITLDKVGTGYTLQATYNGLTSVTTNALNVTATTATKIAVTTQPPSSVTAGDAFDVTVKAEDQFGNVDTTFSGPITIAIANNAGNGTLGGTLIVTAVNGEADFSALTLNKVGTGYTLQATATGLTTATTTPVNVTKAATTQLSVTAQPPATVSAGAPFDVKIAATDAFGNVDKTFTGAVTIALAANPGSDTLGGTLTVNAVNGVADFSTLALDAVAKSYTLSATADSLTSVTTTAFDVLPIAVVINQPTANASTDHAVNFTVQLQDGHGQAVTATQDVTINYAVSKDTGDTATLSASLTGAGSILDNDKDVYQANSSGTTPNVSSLVIHSGESEGTISIPISVELAGSDLKFHLHLTNATGGAALGSATSVLGTIHDDITPPTASIAATASIVEPTVSGQSLKIAVNLSAASEQAVTLQYTVSDGTAKLGTDYSAGTGTVIIPALATSGTISIPILVHPGISATSTFTVTLSAQSGATNVTVDTNHNTSTASIIAEGSFSGFAYVDTNNDGVEESGEHGMAGVTITLAGTTSTGTAVNVTQTTGADGSYNFTHVAPGMYTVTETLPSQYLVGQPLAANGVAVTSSTQFTVLISANSNLTDNDFAARGLQPQYITKRMFLASALG